MTQEKNLLLRTLKKTYHLGLKEDPITEDPKENLVNKKTKEDTITVTTKGNSINEDPQGLHDPQ